MMIKTICSIEIHGNQIHLQRNRPIGREIEQNRVLHRGEHHTCVCDTATVLLLLVRILNG